MRATVDNAYLEILTTIIRFVDRTAVVRDGDSRQIASAAALRRSAAEFAHVLLRCGTPRAETSRGLMRALVPACVALTLAASEEQAQRTLPANARGFAGDQAADTGETVIIDNVTLISPERSRPLLHATILIRDGRIVGLDGRATAGRKAHHIDGTGRFLIPGLIDSHVHVDHSAALDDDAIAAHPELWAEYRAQVPRAYLAFGFTSVVDLDLRPGSRAWFDSTPLHPRLYHCGEGIRVAGGYGAMRVPDASSPAFPNLVFEPLAAKDWPAELNAAVYTPAHAAERVASTGAICAKAFVEPGFGVFDWPYLHTATLRSLKSEAIQKKLLLVAHANGVESWRIAIDARADVIAHGLWIWPGPPTSANPPPAVRQAIADAASARIFVQPTMQTVAGEKSMLNPALLHDDRMSFALPSSVLAYLRSSQGVADRKKLLTEYERAAPAPGFSTVLTAFVQRTRATFSLMLQQHIALILGSDTPAGDGFGNPPGLNGRLEIQAWADAGAPLSLILRAATLENARALGLSSEIGSIEVGKRADLVLLRRNPLRSVDAYDTIEAVVINGRMLSRESLRP